MNNTWILDVLIDTIKFTESNGLPKSAKVLHEAFQEISCELAEALPNDSRQDHLNNVVLLPLSAITRH